MIPILLFVLTGVVTARFIEKKRFHVALVCHTVAFAVLLLYVLLLPGSPLGETVASRVFGAENAAELRAWLYGEAESDTAALILSMITLFLLLQTFAFALAAASKISSLVKKRSARPDLAASLLKRNGRPVQYCEKPAKRRRYITLCSFLC